MGQPQLTLDPLAFHGYQMVFTRGMVQRQRPILKTEKASWFSKMRAWEAMVG